MLQFTRTKNWKPSSYGNLRILSLSKLQKFWTSWNWQLQSNYLTKKNYFNENWKIKEITHGFNNYHSTLLFRIFGVFVGLYLPLNMLQLKMYGEKRDEEGLVIIIIDYIIFFLVFLFEIIWSGDIARKHSRIHILTNSHYQLLTKM